MPPRKSDASKAATGDEGTPAKEAPIREGINIEDLNLPKSIVTRLAKGVLPPNTQIQGNAMLAMTKSATVFVNYLANHANEITQASGKKTITPSDVFRALDNLEFGDFRPRLEAELAKFNEVQTDKRNTYRKKVAADKAKTGSPQPGEGEEGSGEHDGEHDGEGQLNRDGQPAAKKARRDPSDGMGDDSGDIREGDGMGDKDDDEVDDDDGPIDADETEEEEDHNEQEERLEVEEDEIEQRDAEDEALDNGEDSD